ncbi:MAG: hypothetical protein ACJA1A_000314 [Saprospiraceae bacterium]|jgi:hypothetical protein|tara:strand:+ start:850 stop:1200 length:351 start_codon:yes stop_codon:yes gene_type:complete
MAYDIYQQERIDRILTDKNVEFHSKKMMGGLCYMSAYKMLCGIVKDQLMARIGPDGYEDALKMDHVNEMNFTGRAMKGYVFIDGPGMDMDDDLEYWIMKCVAFNPLAKASKKKKKK